MDEFPFIDEYSKHNILFYYNNDNILATVWVYLQDWEEITAAGESCCTQTGSRTAGDCQETMDSGHGHQMPRRVCILCMLIGRQIGIKNFVLILMIKYSF